MTSFRDTAAADPVRDEAMAWRLRQEEGALSPTERTAFDAWLAQSERHREAYEGLGRFWQATGAIDQHPEYPTILRRTEAAVARERVSRRALAASLAAALVGVGSIGLYDQISRKPLANQSFSTGVGQQATVSLPDGSQVTLNTDTVVRTAADEGRRLVYLDRGQAYFKVAKDRRHPFVVTAAGRTVTALGTAFDVRVDHGELKVILVEGKVRVEAARRSHPASSAHPVERSLPMATDMSAGSQLVARNDSEWRLTPTNVSLETSWVKGQLVFEGAPLSEVVEEMNRYSTRKIEIVDPRLGERRVGGNFAPGDVQGFARILEAAGIATLRETPDGRILVVAR